ncbi:MAG: BamA/TamA family outer membrane protein [Prevotellaceae bacterium]|jgi:outer membrane protein assembly factor BamA|nr:BamA/TamA family outer membrane protein [Prevotellaceae bacterium]
MLQRKDNKRYSSYVNVVLYSIAVFIIAACGITKHIPEGQYLLRKVHINVDNSNISKSELKEYLVQKPNDNAIGLWIYNWSGSDTSKWLNRWIRRIGSAPVVYSANSSNQSVAELQQALKNKGYLNFEITVSDTAYGKKAEVTYDIKANEPHRIKNYTIDFPHDEADTIVARWKARGRSVIDSGVIFDMDILEQERVNISQLLRNVGYYSAATPVLHYYADTSLNSNQVDLRLSLRDTMQIQPYYIRNVTVYSGFDAFGRRNFRATDTADYHGVKILYNRAKFLRPSMIGYNTYIRPKMRYSEYLTNRTYDNFSSLGIVQRTTLTYDEVTRGDTAMLDCNVYLTSGNIHGLQAGLDGTNKAGDLGVAANISYSHYNLFNGGEVLNVKLRGAYEMMTGNVDSLGGRNYYSTGIETSLMFPQVHLPFAGEKLRRNLNISTTYSVAFDIQKRPEYQRNFFSFAWRFNWLNQRKTISHSFSILNINYVTMPWKSARFQEYLDQEVNTLTRHTYEDVFTAGLSYSMVLSKQANRRRNYTLRFNFESSGNLLYGIFSLSSASKSSSGQYHILGNPFAQYVKSNIEYSQTIHFDSKSGFAVRAGIGAAYAYGNSTILPFEKRFYGGGPNGVRGWRTRYLGPGSFGSEDVADISLHTGDMNVILSAEFRYKLFSFLETAAFVDSGNIWTLRDYENQPGGKFKPSDFFKEMAIGVGLGLRIDLSFLIVRFDFAKRVYDPARVSDRWTFFSEGLKGNSAFYFAIGYPF